MNLTSLIKNKTRTKDHPRSVNAETILCETVPKYPGLVLLNYCLQTNAPTYPPLRPHDHDPVTSQPEAKNLL